MIEFKELFFHNIMNNVQNLVIHKRWKFRFGRPNLNDQL